MAEEHNDIPEAEHIESQTVPQANPRTGQTALTLSLSLIAGAGLTVMIVALAWGVVDGDANGDLIGILMALGGLTFLGGIAAWAGLVRPWENFDDINEPHYHGHHHEEHDEHDESRQLDSPEQESLLPDAT